MSFLSKMFGRTSFEEERGRAQQLLEQGEPGLAKLAFERALQRARDQPQEVRDELEQSVADCCDRIARRRLEEAERLLADGELELALGELEGAAETAASAELKTEIAERTAAAVRKDERAQVEEQVENDEERFDALSGHWEDEQDEELRGYGDALRSALLREQDGQSAEALAMLEELLAHAHAPRYLHYEVGRLRLVEGDHEGGKAALATFLSKMTEGEGGEARLSAHIELAQLHREAGEFDQAVAQYEAAVVALPDDSRPYLAMGEFLRREGHAQEAAEILQAAVTIEARDRPGWAIAQQLGLTLADLGRKAEAIELLEDALAQLSARGQIVLPVEGTVRLCALQEEAGNPARAADLFRLLARAGAREDRFGYQLEAARLTMELGLTKEARQTLMRAEELAPDDEAARTRLAELSRALDENS